MLQQQLFHIWILVWVFIFALFDSFPLLENYIVVKSHQLLKTNRKYIILRMILPTLLLIVQLLSTIVFFFNLMLLYSSSSTTLLQTKTEERPLIEELLKIYIPYISFTFFLLFNLPYNLNWKDGFRILVLHMSIFLYNPASDYSSFLFSIISLFVPCLLSFALICENFKLIYGKGSGVFAVYGKGTQLGLDTFSMAVAFCVIFTDNYYDVEGRRGSEKWDILQLESAALSSFIMIFLIVVDYINRVPAVKNNGEQPRKRKTLKAL